MRTIRTATGTPVRSIGERIHTTPEPDDLTITLSAREAMLLRLAIGYMKDVGRLAKRNGYTPSERYNGRTTEEEYTDLEARLFNAMVEAGQI